ncbi:MAG: Gx transporter family protein [Ruminococcaceae bacterium]|nr:Gx transporter family protein [Oscillospiraceae bacterium]
MRISVKKLAICGVLSALALVLGYLEHLVPLPIGIYGIKLGLANLAVIVPLYLVGAPAAIAINTVRILLSSLLFGNTVSLWYSLAGAALSITAMLALKATDKFSAMGISICGGITHNIGQMIVAVILVDNLKIAFYLPVLLISGALTGAIIGACALPIIKNKYLIKLCS